MKSLMAELYLQYKHSLWMSLLFVLIFISLYIGYLFIYITSQQFPPVIYTSVLFVFAILNFIFEMMGKLGLYYQQKSTVRKIAYVSNLPFQINPYLFILLVLVQCAVNFARIDNFYIHVILYSFGGMLSVGSLLCCVFNYQKHFLI